MNNAGQVVGYARGTGGNYAFLYLNGAIVDLNTLIPSNSGWTLTSAAAINDAGQIAGTGQIGGATHAFRLDPAASVADPLAVLITTVDGMAPMPKMKALRKHLEQALAALQAGDSQRARNFLNAFEHMLDGHRTQLTADQEQQLLDAAEAAMKQL
jgi:probable HAF family extracellular repeat protein